MKPTLSEALRSLTMTPVECWDDPRLFVMHSAADALDAASGKPVFSDFDFKECTITPEEEKRVRQTGRYLSEHDHLEFWQLDGRVYVLNSRVNPKLTPAAPEKPACDATVSCLVPAPSSPAAERADEGLEEEARELFLASWPGDTDAINSWHSPHNAPGLQERWMNVARAARALRRGGVTEDAKPVSVLNVVGFASDLDSMFRAAPGPFSVPTQAALEALAVKHTKALLDSVVVDRELANQYLDANKWIRSIRAEREAEPVLTEPLFDIAKPLLSAKWDARDPFAVVLRYATRDAATLARASAESLIEHVRKLDAHTHRIVPVREAEKNATPFVVDREKVAHGSWGDITRPDWIDVPFTQPFATPVLMVEAAEHLRSYAVSQERCAHFWREKFKQEASDHAATQGRQQDRTPFKVDTELVAQSLDRHWASKTATQREDARRSAWCAITEYERQRAEHEKGGAA